MNRGKRSFNKLRVKRHMAAALAVCMLAALLMDSSYFSLEAVAAVGIRGRNPIIAITEFHALEEEAACQQVEVGTPKSDLNLPDVLYAEGYEKAGEQATPSTATASAPEAADEDYPGGEPHAITIPNVEWKPDDTYDKDAGGTVYTFTAVLPQNYVPEEGVNMPEIRVEVGAVQAQPMLLNMPLTGERTGNWTEYAEEFDGGTGSKEDPYIIANAEQLAYMATEHVSAESSYKAGTLSADKYYKITAKTIDLSAHYWVPISIFAGNLDGNGCTITGMYCKEPGSGSRNGLGLFGLISPEYSTNKCSEIKNVNFSDCIIKTEVALDSISSQKAGILAGAMYYGAGVTNCSVESSSIIILEEGNAKQTGVGGLIGYFGHNNSRGFDSNSSISDCRVSGIVLKNKGGTIGGLIGGGGYNLEKVEHCTVSDVIIETGGLSVYGGGAYAGGLIGKGNAKNVGCDIVGCAVTGESSLKGINSQYSFGMGGLIGYISNDNAAAVQITVKDCSSEADVESVKTDETVSAGGYGGLIGQVNGVNREKTSNIIENCHATGSVKASSRYAGGLVGFMMGTIKDCYAEGKVENTGFWTGGLVGSMEGYIERCHATGNVSGTWNTGGLAGDTYEGSITNCYATGDVHNNGDESSGGLIGYSNNSEISECYASGSVCSGYGMVGGLIGCTEGASVKKSYATGDVSGDYSVGGFIGCSIGDTITDCYYIGYITAEYQNSGGLCGYAENTGFTDCYSMGGVNAAWDHDNNVHAGGLIGSSKNCQVANSYSKSAIDLQNGEDITAGSFVGYIESETILTNCYFNSETSGLECGVGGGLETDGLNPVSTSDMTRSNQAYYLNENGTNAIWAWDQSVNGGYPYHGSPAVQTLSYFAEVQLMKDGEPWQDSGKTIKASKDDGETFLDLSALEPGFYTIYDGNINTGERLLIENQDETAMLCYYTVTFCNGEIPYGDQTAQAPKILLAGTRIAKPEAPESSGYRFTGWYQDQQLTQPFDFETPVTVRQNLYAGWEPLPDGSQETIIEVAPGSCPVAADNLDRLFAEENLSGQPDSGVTREDADIVKAGGSVTITLSAEQMPSDTPETKVVLNLTVTKEVVEYGESEGTEIRLKQLPTLVTVRVQIPELSEKQDVQVSRIHEGEEQELPYDDEWFEVAGNELILHIRRFSAYFITFSNKSEEPELPPVDDEEPEVPPVDDEKSESSSHEDEDSKVTGRWILDEAGWWYSLSDGTWLSNGWYYLYWNGGYQWYHFDSRGYMENDWFTDIDGKRYYLHPFADGRQGYMYTDWNLIAGRWYYFEPEAGKGQGMLLKEADMPN